ncbi:PREDICTED: LOW QUALITY PROTEIN: putative F-box protein At5g15660 [Brassica oleracea var. oleracea]|uniref:LOW QUALITY PROTEIN: putative F-box protein At5g15660 n=1 Tax=Brassica oleracea var. oleracea TaxID=109376 RepID=UPI0006A70750|nr:PREDICTED: LOW QUALITY PROTEIN: putative F-box protein At5g15660 [Brassica oleracea var. oleracea]
MMITRSKKNKTTFTTNPQTSSSFDGLPLDLVIEILGRFPIKSIARFLLVSKLWATIIHSRDFIESFPLGSCSSQPRFLIAFSGLDIKKGTHYAKEDWYFFSSSFLSRSSCPLPPVYHSHYVKGLLCIGSGREQFTVNPTSGKSIALPRVRTRRRTTKSFFGYDQVNDEYKVLCMTEALSGLHAEGPSSQHQVFTLGAKKKSWRMVECTIPHRPCSSGVCIDGFIYYAAKTGSQRSLMRFDSRSEEFHLITRVPTEIVLSKDQYSQDMIINYQGKVAIPTKTSTYTFDVWVMVQNAEERKWLKKLTFSVEPWKSSCRFIYFKGITQTGEFIMAPYCYDSENVYVALYNHYTDTLRKIKVQVSADFNFKPNLPGIFFSDYIECVRFL